MDWLKDPKNQPKVAAGAAAVIVLVGVFMYFMFFRAPSAEVTPAPADTTTATGTDPNVAPPMDPGAPAPAPGAAPGAAPAGPGGPATQTASAPQGTGSPMESWRDDPFLPLNYKPVRHNAVKATPPIPDLPMPVLPRWRPKRDIIDEKPDMPQPPRRMAGLLLNGRVYAIIESQGSTQIVQPGDRLDDGLAVVDRIERDKVILKTRDARPRYLVIRMASAPGADSGAAPTAISEPMGGRPMGGSGDPMERRPGDFD